MTDFKTPEEYDEYATNMGASVVRELVEQYKELYSEFQTLKDKQATGLPADVTAIHAKLAEVDAMVKVLLAKVGGTEGPGQGGKDPGGGSGGGGGGGTGGGGGGGSTETALFADAVYPSYDTLILTTDDAASIINTGSTNHTYCFEAGLHDATAWSDIVKPKTGVTITGPTVNGDLIQADADGWRFQTGTCGAVIRGSRDISPSTGQSWSKIGGRDAWQTTVAGLPSQLTQHAASSKRVNAGGWVRNVSADNPPLNAGKREEVFIAEPASTTDDFLPFRTAERCQFLDSAAAVDGVESYGGDTPGADAWYLNKTIVGCHINYGTGVVTIGADPAGKVVTISGALGGTSKGRAFGGSTDDLTFRNLHVTQFATDLQNGAFQGGEDRFDWYSKATGWDVQQCHVSNCHGAGILLSTDWYVRYCLFEKMGNIGARSANSGTSPTVIASGWYFGYNILRLNGGSLCYGFNTEVGGCKMTKSKNSTIENCHFHDNIGPNIWWDVDNSEGSSGSQTNTTQRNLSVNGFHGLFYELSDGPANIYRNLCIDNGGFEQHGNPNGHNFRATSQIKVGAAAGNGPGATTKDIDVHENLAVIAPTVAFDSGAGGGGHNSHGITGFCDARDDGNHIKIYNNHVIYPRANTGAQKSLCGFYSQSSNAGQTRVNNLNSTSQFTGNTLYYPGNSGDLIMCYSNTPTDLGRVSLGTFQNKQSDYNNNTISSGSSSTDIPIYKDGCPPSTFNPLTLPRAPRA